MAASMVLDFGLVLRLDRNRGDSQRRSLVDLVRNDVALHSHLVSQILHVALLVHHGLVGAFHGWSNQTLLTAAFIAFCSLRPTNLVLREVHKFGLIGRIWSRLRRPYRFAPCLPKPCLAGLGSCFLGGLVPALGGLVFGALIFILAT